MRIRLRFLGKYAGRSQGVKVGISLTDPLRLFNRLDQTVRTRARARHDASLPPRPRGPKEAEGHRVRRADRAAYAGQGQELYKLDDYNPGYTKDIAWRRVAESPDEALIARVREANVTDAVRIGVVRFAERGKDERAAWTDMLCEALGEVGREVLETGAATILLYHVPGPGGRGGEEERLRGMKSVSSEDIDELAEAVMSCSAAPDSRDVGSVVAESDLVVTGLRELEDEGMARVIARKPLLLVYEKASRPPAFADKAVIWTGKEDLLPLIRKTLER